MIEVISVVLTKVASSLIASGAKAGYAKFTEVPVFEKAVTETCKVFNDIQLRPSLTKWCDSEGFLALLQSMGSGQHPPADADVVAEFIATGGFFCGADTNSVAENILQCFFKQLQTEIYSSKSGLVAVANRQEILHEETQQVVAESAKTIITALTQEFANVIAAQRSLPDKATEQPDIKEKIYHARIDEARKLLESGKPKTARVMLERLRHEISDLNPSTSLLFRIATNLASCAGQLEDKTVAIREIELAFALEPENPKAITNAALACLFKENPKEALRLAGNARERVPNEGIATSNYIQALFALGDESAFEELIKAESWITKDSNCCFTIGSLFFNQNRYEEAEAYARRA
jgi:tetratricopeptide (TPR) repeat protein